MALRAPLSLLAAVLTFTLSPSAPSQVFTVGEHTAIADLPSDFAPTAVVLSGDHLTERGRRELVRMLVAEQGFAHRPLPISSITLEANGPLRPGAAEYRHLLFQKGQAAGAGDRVMVTAFAVESNRLVIDLNGGPFAKHRFLSHVQLNNSNVAAPQPQATGARVSLVFPHGVPDITAAEVKSLLEPVIDFGVKSSEQAYADTLPTPIRQAIASHEVLVGMNHRMVIAALGQPDSKVRERDGLNGSGSQYEEWIYGHVPQTVHFVRFVGDRVSLLEIAELGKPIQIHKQNEMGDFVPAPPTREIQMGDVVPGTSDAAAPGPSLKLPSEAPSAGASGRVQMPSQPGGSPSPTKP